MNETLPANALQRGDDDPSRDACPYCQGKGAVIIGKQKFIADAAIEYFDHAGNCWRRCLRCNSTGRASEALAKSLAAT